MIEAHKAYIIDIHNGNDGAREAKWMLNLNCLGLAGPHNGAAHSSVQLVVASRGEVDPVNINVRVKLLQPSDVVVPDGVFAGRTKIKKMFISLVNPVIISRVGLFETGRNLANDDGMGAGGS